MHKSIANFVESVTAKIAKAYNDELVSIVSDAPKGVVNFNNVTVLKKGQRYIRHTDLVFNKAIAALFLDLFTERQVNCILSKDRMGRGLYLCDEKNYKHFMPQEKVVGFPKVSWYREFNRKKQSDISNTYVVLVENSHEGRLLVSSMNEKTESRNAFTTLEEFTVQYFGWELWVDLSSALKQLEASSKKYKWFDLAEICTTVNRQVFSKTLDEEIRLFDYEGESRKYDFPTQLVKSLSDAYLEQNQYELLLSSEDFAMSFFSSEWLFKNYFHNDCIEKTYVMSGYLKSLEQLLAYSIGRSCSQDFSRDTLGNMVYYLRQRKNHGVFNKSLDSESINIIVDVIDKLGRKERNEYFHKQNVDDTEVVRNVRNMTLLLYCIIVGALC